MRVLVTGAGGFIGSWLCKQLVSEGHQVRAMLHYNTDKQNLDTVSDRIETFLGDVRFPDECAQAVKTMNVVAHLAARISVDESKHNPQAFWNTNVGGTYNILEAARQENAKVMFMSSCEVIGNVEKGEADESYPWRNPCSPYAASKQAGEAYCFSYGRTYPTFGYTVARCFNQTGPRQSLKAMIPRFISMVLDGKAPTIFGDGLQIRDYTDARDTVRGLAKLLDGLEKGLYYGEVFHFASGKEYTILDVTNTILESCGSELKPVFLSPRSGELQRSVGKAEKAFMHLDWAPKVKFTQTVEDIVEYMKWSKGQYA